MAQRTGVLLINLGTPDSPSPADVRTYLAEFLSDPKVLTIPAPIRWLLLHGVILRVRPRKSAEAYQQVWQPEGSPLLIHGRALRAGVAEALGDGFEVVLAMRYGRPTMSEAIAALAEKNLDRIIVLPLFPQYSEAATGSALAHADTHAAGPLDGVDWRPIRSFHDDAGFIAAAAAPIREAMDSIDAEHLLLSYHGLPESQVRATPGCTIDACCAEPGERLPDCYRAQCFGTSRALVAALGLPEDRVTVAFQSRVGLNRWIQPFTDEVLPELRARGVSRLAVACPAFVADCLETLEEIDIRLREQWAELGGDQMAVAPCVNASPAFVEAVKRLVEEAAA